MANRGNEGSIPASNRDRDQGETFGSDESIRGVGDSGEEEFEQTEDEDVNEEDEEDEKF